MSSTTTERPAVPRRERTRARLIQACVEVIGEKGFQAATLDEIAGRAGLTKGAIYDNFRSKDDLFLAVVMGASSNRLERFPWPTGRHGTVRERLRRLGEAVLADAPAAQREAPLRAEFLLYSLTHEEVRSGVAAAAPQRLKAVEERLLELFAPDELRLPLDKFVVLIEALIPGLMFLRAQAPEIATDETVIAAFEALA